MRQPGTRSWRRQYGGYVVVIRVRYRPYSRPRIRWQSEERGDGPAKVQILARWQVARIFAQWREEDCEAEAARLLSTVSPAAARKLLLQRFDAVTVDTSIGYALLDLGQVPF